MGRSLPPAATLGATRPAAKPKTRAEKTMLGVIAAGIVALAGFLVYPLALRALFFHALKSDDDATAIRLLRLGIDPNAKDGALPPNERSALCIAVRRNRIRVVQALVSAGANIYLEGDYNDSPFTIAFLKRNAAAMHILLANDQPLWEAVADNLLVRAAAKGETDNVAWLLDHGAAVNAGDANGYRAYQHKRPAPGLHNAAKKGGHGSDGGHAIIAAAASGSPDTVACLLRHGADVNIKDAGGLAAIMCPAANGNSAVARLLLEHAPDLRARDGQGRTALTWTTLGPPATASGRMQVAALLRAAGERE